MYVFIFLIEIWLIYNAVLVSDIQQWYSYTYIYICAYTKPYICVYVYIHIYIGSPVTLWQRICLQCGSRVFDP